jgi:protein phosphatase methylesterase 1
MSDLARTFAKSKLSSLPPEPPLFEDRPSGPEDDGDSSSASSLSSTGTVVPSGPYKPAVTLPWSNFFAQELWLEDSSINATKATAKYHAYFTPPATEKAPLIVLHHGAGSSAMSFALFALDLRRLLPEAGILAVEAREHGSVVFTESGEVDNDLSISNLSADLHRMILLTASKLSWPTLPRLLLVGHSLGGAVVTHLSSNCPPDLRPKLLGFSVLDVVEGSAMDALKSMNAYLANRPSTFNSIDQAITWHIRSRTLRNIESARASVPSLLIQTDDGEKWTWRTDLSRTEAYWQNWFNGMSGKFLSGRGAKLLLLAGTDRLDKELMIGQMQGKSRNSRDNKRLGRGTESDVGKFQLQVFPAAGHFIQEDLPERTAEVIAEFFKRNDQSALVLPPKVSDLLAQGKKV